MLEERLSNYIEQTCESARSLLAVYMQWYTFYWVLSVGVLAWNVQSGSAGVPGPVACLFIGASLFATVSSFVVLGALRRMSDAVVECRKALYAGNAALNSKCDLHIWPPFVLYVGLWANGLTTLGLAAIWIWIIWK